MDFSDPKVFVPIAAVIIAGLFGIYFIFLKAWVDRRSKKIQERYRLMEEQGDAAADEKAFEKRYLDYIYHSNCCFEIQGLPTQKPLSVDLERLYVPLKAQDIDRERIKFFADEDYDKLKGESGDDNDLHHLQEQPDPFHPVALTDALRKHNKLVILGCPGSGKTTFLRYLAAVFARNKQGESLGLQEARIPIVIALRDLNPDNLPSVEKLPEICIPKDLNEQFSTDSQTKESYCKQNLSDGRCLFLLDGLDEVADKSARQKVSKWVMELMHMYPENRFVVTSRILGYQDAPLGGGFAGYTLCSFERKDVERFCKHWYHVVETNLHGDTPESRKVADDQTSKLTQAIFDNDRIERLAVNPLMLSLIAIVHRDRDVLPKRRAQLYNDCINVLLGRWDEAKGLAGSLIPEQKAHVLMHVARHLHENRSRDIEAKKLKEVLASGLHKVFSALEHDVDVFLEEIRLRSGLIIEHGKHIFGFSHLTFQEYLTARALKEEQEGESYLFDRKDSSWWREVILLYCGLQDATSFAAKLADGEDDMFHSNLFLAGECLADCLECDRILREKIQGRLFELFDSGDHELLRNFSQKTLALFHSKDVEQEFIRRLTHENKSIRVRAVSALGDMCSETAVDALIEALKDEDEGIRLCVVDALGKIRSERAEEPLLEVLNDGDGTFRKHAAHALRAISWEAAMKPLLASLKDSKGSVRANAAEILGRTGSEEAIEPLIEALKDNEWTVRTIAADALGEMRAEAAVGPLLEAVKDEDELVRDQAAQALRAIRHEGTVAALLKELKDGDSNIRARAALALGGIGSDAAVEPLIESLKDKDEFVRRGAAEALGKIASEAALKPLIEALRDKDHLVHGNAVEALGRIGSPAVLEPLQDALKDENSYVRFHAAEALGKMGAPQTVEPLTRLLDDKHPGVRDAAFRALYEIHRQQKE